MFDDEFSCVQINILTLENKIHNEYPLYLAQITALHKAGKPEI